MRNWRDSFLFLLSLVSTSGFSGSCSSSPYLALVDFTEEMRILIQPLGVWADSQELEEFLRHFLFVSARDSRLQVGLLSLWSSSWSRVDLLFPPRFLPVFLHHVLFLRRQSVGVFHLAHTGILLYLLMRFWKPSLARFSSFQFINFGNFPQWKRTV